MRNFDEQWATDTPISMPVPPPRDAPVMTDFDGFGFSMNGITHNLTEPDLEEMTTPFYAPEGFLGSDPSGAVME
jgi:hypothetical protein